MQQVKTKSIKYIPGEYAYTNGHKRNEYNHYNATTGTYVTQKGFGWASEWKPSKIIVRICTEDGETEVWVDKYFREHWGRLTAKRIKKIMDSMPDTLEVHENIARSGTVYYMVDDSSLSDWLMRAK